MFSLLICTHEILNTCESTIWKFYNNNYNDNCLFDILLIQLFAILLTMEIFKPRLFCSHATSHKADCWLKSANFQLAGQKTEAILKTSRKKIEYITLNIRGHNITSQLALRYLGGMIGVRLNFRTNVEKACEKAARMNAELSRIMTNIGGPNQSRRLLLAKVTQSIMMYTAPVWGPALEILELTLGLQSLYFV